MSSSPEADRRFEAAFDRLRCSLVETSWRLEAFREALNVYYDGPESEEEIESYGPE